jgi:hypothetical protein
MSGSVYRCKNHPDLRWFDTKPNGKLCFLGKIADNGDVMHAGIAPIPPVAHLRSLLNGRNPFAEELETEQMTKWEDVVDFVKYIEEQSQKYAFECICPGSDLEVVADEDANELLTRR